MRGPVLRPPCMRQRSLPRIEGARQGHPARVRAPQRGASARLGLPREVGAVGGAEVGLGWALELMGLVPGDVLSLFLYTRSGEEATCHAA